MPGQSGRPAIRGLLPGPQAGCATKRDPRGRHKSPPAGPGHPVSSSAAQVTVFDPDLDPDGSHARLLTDILSTGLTPLSRDRR